MSKIESRGKSKEWNSEGKKMGSNGSERDRKIDVDRMIERL